MRVDSNGGHTVAGGCFGSGTMITCTLRQLEVFVAAAEDCHFARTAIRLGISQAAVSSQIAALESQVGRLLFVRRRGRKPVLSRNGLVLFGEARSRMAETEGTGGSQSRPHASKRLRTVRIGAGAHLLDDCIKRRLSQFHKQQANLNLECHYVDSTDQGIRLVQNGRVDMLVHTVPNPSEYSLHAEILKSVRFGLYASRKYSSSRGASPAELSALPFILPPEDSPACNMVEATLLDAGIDCRNVVARAQFTTVAKDLARQGLGIVPLFDTMISSGDTDELIQLDVELPMMYRTLFRVNRALDTASRSVEGFLREALGS